jgi:hypothetical protein
MLKIRNIGGKIIIVLIILLIPFIGLGIFLFSIFSIFLGVLFSILINIPQVRKSYGKDELYSVILISFPLITTLITTMLLTLLICEHINFINYLYFMAIFLSVSGLMALFVIFNITRERK